MNIRYFLFSSRGMTGAIVLANFINYQRRLIIFSAIIFIARKVQSIFTFKYTKDTNVNRLSLFKIATLNKSDKTFIAVQRRLSNPDASLPDEFCWEQIFSMLFCTITPELETVILCYNKS